MGVNFEVHVTMYLYLKHETATLAAIIRLPTLVCCLFAGAGHCGGASTFRKSTKQLNSGIWIVNKA